MLFCFRLSFFHLQCIQNFFLADRLNHSIDWGSFTQAEQTKRTDTEKSNYSQLAEQNEVQMWMIAAVTNILMNICDKAQNEDERKTTRRRRRKKRKQRNRKPKHSVGRPFGDCCWFTWFWSCVRHAIRPLIINQFTSAFPSWHSIRVCSFFSFSIYCLVASIQLLYCSHYVLFCFDFIMLSKCNYIWSERKQIGWC